MEAAPRIEPGTRAEIGRANFAIARMLGLVAGTGPPNLFTTLARHRRVFRKWLRFAGALMPGGLLPRDESELLILRVAHNSGCEYEWRHHERIGRQAGLSTEEIERVRSGPEAHGWSERRALLLRACDELHAERTIAASTWAALAENLSDPELLELCLLVGHYEMLAMTLNSAAIAPDPVLGAAPPRAFRVLAAAVQRRQERRS